jgi:O-antigen ligase
MLHADRVPGLLAFVLVLLLGFDDGGFAPTSWVWSAALLAVVAGALLTGRARSPAPLELGFLGALAGLFLWTLGSAGWSLDRTGSALDAERLLLYLATATALVLLAGPGSRPALLMGVLAAIVVLCAAGLVDAAVGDEPIGAVTDDPGSADRLAEPVGYANGMALLAAMGSLLAVGLALAPAHRLLRAACVALVPLFLAALYLTYSRGGWLALALGLLTLFVVRIGPRNRRLVVAVSAVLVVGVIVAGIALARSFSSPTEVPATGAARLRTLSGSSRADYWRVALGTVEDEPLVGSGAGSFRRRWYRHRPVPQPATDAHSLYLETLAELGPLGLALLLAALGVPLAAAVGTRTDPITAAAVAPYVAFLAHSAQDWDWELPAVTVPALACATALVLAARQRWVPLSGATRAAGAVTASALAVAALAAYAGNRELALAEGGSESAARRAARLQPWSAAPWHALGRTQLERGDLESARASFRKGLGRDDGDWELWLDLALASDGAEQREAYARALRLNPRDPDVQELRDE